MGAFALLRRGSVREGRTKPRATEMRITRIEDRYKNVIFRFAYADRQYDSADGSDKQGCQTSMAQIMANIALNATPNTMG